MKAGPGQLPGPVSMKSSRSAQHSTSLRKQTPKLLEEEPGLRVPYFLLAFGRRSDNGIRFRPDPVFISRFDWRLDPRVCTTYRSKLQGTQCFTEFPGSEPRTSSLRAYYSYMSSHWFPSSQPPYSESCGRFTPNSYIAG